MFYLELWTLELLVQQASTYHYGKQRICPNENARKSLHDKGRMTKVARKKIAW
jgi:hypothetical protein